MDNLLNFIPYDNIIYIIRIIIATSCGFLIGYERENKNKDAGIRTHCIVALGSCLTMLLSKYGFFDVGRADATRIASQAVSGIGFLGAGIIFIRRDRFISGLTTAAGIWTTSIISMTIGAGLLTLGIFSTFLVLFLQLLLTIFKKKYNISGEEVIYLTIHNNKFNLEAFTDKLYKLNIDITHLEIEKIDQDLSDIELVIHLPKDLTKWKVTTSFLTFDGIDNIKMS